MAQVQPSHVAQCIKELLVRCLDPRKMRTKTYLLGNWSSSEYETEARKTKLSLHHKSHCPQPPNLGSVSNYKR